MASSLNLITPSSILRAQWDDTAPYTYDFSGGDLAIYDEQAQDEFFTQGKRRRFGRRQAEAAGWVAGAEATWFRPSLSSLSPLSISISSPPVNRSVDGSPSNLREFEPGGRVWLGWQTHETGWLGRYSQFDSSAAPGRVDPADPLHTFFTRQDLQLSAWDIEWHRRWWNGPRRLDMGFGLRFAQIEHTADLHLVAEVQDGLAFGTARSVREARGIGPVLSADAWQPIGQGTHWGWFWSTRSAALFGRHENSTEVLAVLSDTPVLAQHDLQRDEADRLLWIAELQLGLLWHHPLPGDRIAVLRIAGEYQYWATWMDTVSAAAAVDQGSTTIFVESGNSPLRLSALGMAVGVQVNY